MVGLALLGFLPSSGRASREELRAVARVASSFQSFVQDGIPPLLWRDHGRERLDERLWRETGWALVSVSLGGRRSAVGLIPRRCYFEQPSGGSPLRARESELLVGSGKPRPEAPGRQLQAGLELLRELSGDAAPLELTCLSQDLASDVVIRIGAAALPTRDRLAGHHEKHGVDAVPDRSWIALVPEPGVAEGLAESFRTELSHVLERRRLDGRVRVRVRAVPDLEAALVTRSDSQEGSAAWEVGAVWFLLRSRIESTSARMLDLFRRLDERGLAWRRAYADDPIRFSVRDQAASLLQAVGGSPHRIGLRGGKALPWSLGVDLSHAHSVDRSRLCVALVDPGGRLTGAWVCTQPRDETARPESLRPLLRAARSCLEREGGAEIVLALRDGRFFENENPALYREELGTRVELLELAKHNNPPLLESMAGGAPKPPRGAVAGVHGSGEWVYLLPGVTQEVGGLESVLKFRRRRGGDSADFGDRELAEILVALTYAPGLGSRRSRFPAPIYWADGIAGASDTDLRFRGQRAAIVEPIDGSGVPS